MIRMATRTASIKSSKRPSNTVVQRAAKMTTAKVGGGCSICKGLERPQERSNNQPATSNNGADSHKQQQQWNVSNTTTHGKGADSQAMAASQATSAIANKWKNSDNDSSKLKRWQSTGGNGNGNDRKWQQYWHHSVVSSKGVMASASTVAASLEK